MIILMLQETFKSYFDQYYYYYYHQNNNQTLHQQQQQQSTLKSFDSYSRMFSIAFSMGQYLSYLLYGITVFIVKGYISFYILTCCHEILEDHREGTVNARSKSVHLLISILTLIITFIGLYGVYIFHLGLLLTWLILKPFIRLLDLESPTLNVFVMIVVGIVSTICYNTYDVFHQYTASPLF